MQRSKPETGHDIDMQGPAQLAPADRSGSRAGASMAMAVLTGAALLSYLGILFVVRAAQTEAAVSDHD
jgi:hypothetical protein